MVLTDSVASVNGAWIFRDWNVALYPDLLKPCKLPVQVMLLATVLRWSVMTDFVTIPTAFERC